MRVYIAHPYEGKQENIDSLERIVRHLIKCNQDIIIYSPVHAFGYLYNDMEYDKGMEWCYDLLKQCDILMLCPGWMHSTGCILEKNYADRNGIPVFYLGGIEMSNNPYYLDWLEKQQGGSEE